MNHLITIFAFIGAFFVIFILGFLVQEFLTWADGKYRHKNGRKSISIASTNLQRPHVIAKTAPIMAERLLITGALYMKGGA